MERPFPSSPASGRYDGYFEHYFSIGRKFSEKHYHSMRPAFRHYFGRFLPVDKDAAIADVACGCGEFLHFLQGEGYRNTHGADALDTHVEVARGAGVQRVDLADAREWLSSRLNAFDLVSAHDFLEHLPVDEVIPFLRLAHAALKPGGALLVSTPNADSLFGGRTRYCDFTHFTSFTPSSLRYVLSAAGFEGVEVLPKEPVAHGLVSIVRVLLWKTIKQFIRVYLLAETGTAGSGVFTQVMYAAAHKPVK